MYIRPTWTLLLTDNGVRKCVRPSFISWVHKPYSGECMFLAGVFASSCTPLWTNLFIWLNGVLCLSPTWAEWAFLTGLHNGALFIGVELLYLSATAGISGVLAICNEKKNTTSPRLHLALYDYWRCKQPKNIVWRHITEWSTISVHNIWPTHQTNITWHMHHRSARHPKDISVTNKLCSL